MRTFHPTIQHGIIVMVETPGAYWVQRTDAEQLQHTLTDMEASHGIQTETINDLNISCNALGFDARCWKALKYLANNEPELYPQLRNALSTVIARVIAETDGNDG